jgi:YfiH family protein
MDAGKRKDWSAAGAKILVVKEFAGRGAFAAFSSRLGGVSRGPFESLNLGNSVGDDPACVAENKALFWAATGLDARRAVRAQQVHSDVVAAVDAGHAGCVVRGADALVTREPGLPLVTGHADCVPIFFLDPVTRSGGLAHAGWRGTIRGIARRVVERLSSEYGVRASDLLAVIGPSAGPCCYEVGEDVQRAARDHLPWALDVLEEMPLRASGRRWKFNMWEANRRLLMDAGLEPRNVVCWDLCTACSPDLFFSYRRDGPRSGRMEAVFALEPDPRGVAGQG